MEKYMNRWIKFVKNKRKSRFTTEGIVDMEQTFYIGMKICDYYTVYINDDGYEQKEMVQEDEIDGFIHCLKVLGYKEI